MSVFFRDDHEKLNDKISNLQKEVDGLKYSLLTSHIASSWETIMDLMKEIQEDFKTVRYPNKQDRENAWQKFFELRQEIYLKKKQWFEDLSKNHKDSLFDMINNLEYWALREGLRQMFFTELNEIKAEVIENGKKLNEAAKYFSSVKHEMTGDDKQEIFNRIKEIRESHDEFWGIYKSRSQELHEAKEERKDSAKNKLIENIENNKEKLEKAERALAHQESHRDELEENLRSAYSDSYRERCEGWLDECREKISDIESYSDKLKGWIEDGEDRLRNWD